MENFKSRVVNIDALPNVKCALKEFVTVRENGYLVNKVEDWRKK